MRTIYVISGVTGMTGNELARQLIKNKENEVVGFDNFFASSIDTIEDIIDNPHLHFFERDINNEKHLQEIKDKVLSLGEGKVVYINCAAVVHTEYFYEINSTYETNVESMRKFLQQAIEIKASIFINCSTSEVYSMHSWADGGVRESDFLELATAEHSQRTSYATGKLLTEFFMKDVVEKGLIRGCSIRFANVYSNHERFAKHIIPHIINSLREKEEVVLLENSRKNKRTFLHNIDSCRAVLDLIESPVALDGSVYNVATDEEISIIDLVNKIGKKLGLESPRITFKDYRLSDPKRRILNTEKIREKTKWKPIISLDKGLDLCLEQFQQ